jgi:membrane protease YdiL (CAAX protease family)
VARWGAFLAVVAILTALLLVLARQSQQLLREQATETTDDPPVGDPDTERAETGEKSRGPDREPDDAAADPVRPDSRGVETLSPGVLLANVAFTQALVAVSVVAAGWYFAIPASAFGIAAEPMQAGLPGVAVGFVFGGTLWLANEFSTVVADEVGATYDERVRELLAPETNQGWLVLFLGVLPVIAVAEELLFRAALVGVPDAGFGVSPWLLALVSSLAFALGHGAQGRVGIVVTGLLGVALAAGYLLTGSLLVVVVAHYVVNALEFGVHELLGVDILPE